MERLKAEIERLRQAHSYRALKTASGRDFTSNDYLGLAAHPALREAAKAALDEYGVVGAGGSRLLRGHHLEERAAEFFQSPKALYFGSGYLANLALFSTLPDRHDAVIFDEFVHASMKEGIHAGVGARFKVPHNDVAAFRDNLARARTRGAKGLWIAVESVYSMDGDFAPLKELADLAQEFNATLIVDEAHATGVFGATGRGLCEGLTHVSLIGVHTCGKSLGVSGALVSASELIVDYLVNKARPFVYATASPPLLPAGTDRRRALAARAIAGAGKLRPSDLKRGRGRRAALCRKPDHSGGAGRRRTHIESRVGAAGRRVRRARDTATDGADGHVTPAHLDQCDAERDGYLGAQRCAGAGAR